MNNKKEQKKIIDLLVANEAILSELYQVYAKELPKTADFWNEIAEEEKSHAMWLETLHRKMDADWVDFAEDRFSASAIKQNIDYLEQKKKKADGSLLDFAEVLEDAVHIESGMLESKFFEVFKDDSIELKIVLEGLKLSTKQHLEKLKAKLDDEKNKNFLNKK